MLIRPLLLLLLALLAHAPQVLIPGWQGTEGRRVQIAMEMAESGDLLVPTLGGETTFAKPPLYYWVLSGVQELFDPARAAMRLPSVVGWWLLACLAFAVLRRMFDPTAGWIGAAGILLSPVLVHDGPRAEIDALFSVFTAGSLLLLAFGVARVRRSVLLAAGVVGGLAMLTKGPPYLMFAAGSLLVWWRHRRLCGLLWFIVPLLLVQLCYYLPLFLLRVAPAEFFSVASQESVGRLQFLEWERVAKIPLYLVRTVLVVLPFGLWAAYEFRGSRDARMGPADLMLRMLTAASIVSVVLLAFFPARPTRYLLPMVPMFIVAVAPAVAHYYRCARQLGPLARGTLPVLGPIGAVGLIALPFLPFPMPGRSIGLCLVLALLPICVRRPRQLVIACLVLPLVAAWTVLSDRADYQWASGRQSEVVATPLLREMRALGATDDLQTYGHLHSALLVEGDLLPPGDELKARSPSTRWVLYEETDKLPGATPELPGYVDRVRVRLRSRTFALAERAGAGGGR